MPTILCEIDPCEAADPNRSLKKAYIYGNSQILMQRQYDGESSQNYFYIHDCRGGSIRLIISESGEVVKSYSYSPFGETIEEGGSVDNAFMFTGQYYDEEINQYYLRARQYDPVLMRFASRDPKEGEYEKPLTLHPYLYCLNGPINHSDPTGRFYDTGYALAWGAEMWAADAAVGGLAMAYCAKMLMANNAIVEATNMIIGGMASGMNRLVDIGLSWYGNLTTAMSSRTWQKDPTVAPGEGWIWQGDPEAKVGSKKGNWVNEKTGEQIHRDRDHAEPKGPHDDYTDENGDEWDMYPDGRVVPKK